MRGKKMKPMTKAVLKLAFPLLMSVLTITQIVCAFVAITLDESYAVIGFTQAAISTGVIAIFSWAYRIYLIKEIKKEYEK